MRAFSPLLGVILLSSVPLVAGCVVHHDREPTRGEIRAERREEHRERAEERHIEREEERR